MRPIFLLILTVLSIAACAQGRERTFKTDTGIVVLHYFTNGKVSTKAWMDKDDRWGRSWAYKPDGAVLVEHQTRRIAGHAGVHFTYHPNGAVSKAEYSEAPDAGIQWYRSTTTFDDQGNKTGFTEQGHDNHGIIPGPGVRVTQKPEVTEPYKQEVVREQRMFVTEVFVVNASKYTCRMDVIPKHPSPAMQNSNHTMAPGDTVRVGMYSTGEIYEEAAKHLTLSAKRWSRKSKKQVAYKILREEIAAVQPEARKYYLLIGR
ncbi:MAG: hypothetical protein IPL52_02065 [Flavobacteriales bacterium]|nr:hypothetical protein [Flavobacteriales bacterium]